MIKALRFLFTVALMTFSVTALYSQSLSVQGGYLSLIHDSSFTGPLRAYGVTIVQSDNSLDVDKYIPYFKITGGLMDSTTGSGEIQTEGGFVYSNGARALEVRRFILDTTGVAPVITGLVFVNGLPMGRMPLYILYNMENIAGPLAAGPLQNHNNLYLTLSAPFRNAMDNFAHISLPANAWIGWLTIRTSLVKDLGPR